MRRPRRKEKQNPLLTRASYCQRHSSSKMRMSIVVVLVVAVLLVTHCDAWRGRRVWRRAVSIAKPILVQAATAKAATALAGAVGKRDVECTGQLTDEEVAEIARELEERCLSLDFDSEVGLTKDTVDATFDASDANNDGSLTEEELETFSDTIDAYEECEVIEDLKRK